MSYNKIHKKLKDFLMQHPKIKEECELVYIMTEIRKIIKIKKQEKEFKILNFYCNWVLHDKLNYSPTLKYIDDKFINIDFNQRGKSIAIEMKSKHSDFFKFNDLKNDLILFLDKLEFSRNILSENWIFFLKKILEIIEECKVDFSKIKNSKFKTLNIEKDQNSNSCFRFVLKNVRKPRVKLKFK